MTEEREQQLQAILNFHMPAYSEIPDVGLYLEQVTKFVAEYLAPLEGVSITGSMISNYVKKKMVKNPVKKQYGRDQITVILFIAVAKSVISMEEIQVLLKKQEADYSCREAYEYFCRELENALAYVFGSKETMDSIGTRNSAEKTLLRNVIVAVAHKICLEYSFRAIMESQESHGDGSQ